MGCSLRFTLPITTKAIACLCPPFDGDVEILVAERDAEAPIAA